MTTRERAKAYADAKTKHLEGGKHRDAWWTWFDAYMEIAEAEKAESDKELEAYVGMTAKEATQASYDKAKQAFDKAVGWCKTYQWYQGVYEEFVKNLEG